MELHARLSAVGGDSFQDSYFDSEIEQGTHSRLSPKRPLILVCGARPEERACLLRSFPLWDFRFVPFQNLAGIYTEMSLRPEASAVLMAKRYISGPEMISFFCQAGVPYYLFDNKSDLSRGEWAKNLHQLAG